jgi:hypothetical protein
MTILGGVLLIGDGDMRVFDEHKRRLLSAGIDRGDNDPVVLSSWYGVFQSLFSVLNLVGGLAGCVA